MSLYTGQALINIAFQNLTILDQGGTPSVSDSQSALTLLNEQLEQWQINDLYIWSVGKVLYPLVTGQQVYQIGPGAADFDVPRPNYIETALISLPGPNPVKPVEYPVKLIGQEEYAQKTDKAATGAIPACLYNDRASPISNLYVWPTARCVLPTNLILYTWAQLTLYPDLTTAYDLPTGYAEAITNALAIRCAPMFGAVVASGTLEVLNQLGLAAEQKISALNARARGMMMADAGAK